MSHKITVFMKEEDYDERLREVGHAQAARELAANLSGMQKHGCLTETEAMYHSNRIQNLYFEALLQKG